MSSLPSTTKIVLVTGANQGIGLAIAKSLSSKPDYHVLMGSRNAERGIEAVSKLREQGLSVEPVTLDVTLDKSIKEAVSTVTSKFGRLDILINNAGISLPADAQGTGIRSTYQDIFEANTFGAALTTEAFIPLLSLSSAPRIIFMSSNLGSLTFQSQGVIPGVLVPIYRASKAALNMLMLHYAAKYKDVGWKINSCCPGYCKTNLTYFMGIETPESGAIDAVRLATLEEDGETGTFSDKAGVIPW